MITVSYDGARLCNAQIPEQLGEGNCWPNSLIGGPLDKLTQRAKPDQMLLSISSAETGYVHTYVRVDKTNRFAFVRTARINKVG